MYSSCPSGATRAEMDTAKPELLTLDEYFTSLREKAKFDRDVSEGERGSAYFVRSPTPSNFKVAIPDVRRSDGTITSDAGEMAAKHRAYWGTIYQSPSNDLRDFIPMRRYDPMRMQDLLQYTENKLTAVQRRRLDAL
ncbi:hypothetical protein PsorP6_009505 [Peronosclerospora sorghi]|uniref:Uncharacterized protein n=1 Tax=Peronosclerospora sorghi TaxID=230839 RepID=A0ACC0VY10_9STRA|nr:hypothetical protein PsorP6_009505 [Peronosclerospora sorghi]